MKYVIAIVAIYFAALCGSAEEPASGLFRSIRLECHGEKLATLLINMEAEMKICYANDSLIVSTPACRAAFAAKDVSCWSFSPEWSEYELPVRPAPDQGGTTGIETVELPDGVLSFTDSAAGATIYSVDGSLVATVPPGVSKINFRRFGMGVYIVKSGKSSIKIAVK